MLETVLLIILLIILIGLSAFFSVSETAFTSVHKVRLKNLINEGSKRAERTLNLSENYDKLLTTILVGNNLANILSSAICTWLFTLYFGAWGVALATVFMLIIILTFGEITPKSVAKRNPERYAMALTPAISFTETILTPVSWMFLKLSNLLGRNTIKVGNETPTLTEKELVVMIDEIEGEGTLEKTESELIKSAIEFDDKAVSEILVPRVDIIAVDKSISIEDMKRLLLSSGFSRIPVFDGTIDRVIGVIYAKDFYNRYFEGSNASIEDIIRPVKFIPETTTVARALSEIQKSMVQMVIVVDSYGGTVGIVSLEDVLEELVGEIWDESDEVQYSVVKDSDGSYLALGEANIYDMMKEIGIEFDTGEYDGHTLGGYIQYKLNRVPTKGDRLDEGEVKMIVRTTKNRRIKLVQVILKKEPEPSVESL